jgi:carbon catabolite-derepressing protein kinase
MCHAGAKYYMPPFVNPDAQGLIRAMLTVAPTERIKIPEITRHPFYTTDLPRYLMPLPQRRPVLATLSALVTPPNILDFEIIEGLGRIEEDIVDELTSRLEGIDREEVWDALRRDNGVQSNRIRVSYLLLRDKRRLGRDRESVHYSYVPR